MDALHIEWNVNPLHDAVRENDVNAIKKLLLVHDVNEMDLYSLTPLHWACDFVYEDAANALLDSGANIHAVEERLFKRQPIHFAASRGSVSLMKRLVAQGVDVDVVDGHGKTPLHYCVVGGHQEAVQWLLEQGADRNASTQQGESALSLANQYSHPEIAALLEQV